MVQREFRVEGMSCQHCVMAVKKELAKVAGLEVRDVRIGSVSVAYDDMTLDSERIEAAITEAGYRIAH